MIVHCPEYIKLIIMASMRIIDAVACVKKYLVAASIDRGEYFFIRTGTMAIMFISKPNQVINQCELVITMDVPNMIVPRRIIKIIGLISRGRY